MTDNADHLDALRTALAGGPAPVEVLKRDDRSTVELLDVNGRRWVRKTYHLPAAKQWSYAAIGKLPAQREAANAARLAKLDIRVPQPMHRINGALIMPFVKGLSLHEFVSECDDPTQRNAVARAVGRQMRVLVDAGLVNRDHKARNLIIDDACLAGDQPLLIDPVGLRRATPDRTARMVARLLETCRKAGRVSGDEIAAFCEGAGVAEADRPAWRWRIEAVYERVAGHPL